MKTPKMQVCRECGSTQVHCDAFAEWEPSTQTWEIADLFDKGAVCEPCGGECRIVERDMTLAEIAEFEPGE